MNVVIIPAYEPGPELCAIVRKLVQDALFPVVIDDGSGEQYQEIFDEIGENVVVLKHSQNLGKGRAIKTALLYILEELQDAGQIVVMDADGQHSIKDVKTIFFVAKQHADSLVLGVRTFSKDIPKASRIGNMLTRNIFLLTSGVAVSDTQTGLRGFTKALIPTLLEVSGERYEYEMNVLYTCAKRKIPIVEVPIKTIYHDENNSCSHFHKIKDSLRIYKQVLRFTLASLSSFLIDYFLFGVFMLVFNKVQIGIMLSNVLARMISGTYNYCMNERFVFRKKERRGKAAIQYVALALFILCMNNIILSVFVDMMHVLPMLAKVITELLLFLISFVIQKMIIFKHHTAESVCDISK